MVEPLKRVRRIVVYVHEQIFSTGPSRETGRMCKRNAHARSYVGDRARLRDTNRPLTGSVVKPSKKKFFKKNFY